MEDLKLTKQLISVSQGQRMNFEDSRTNSAVWRDKKFNKLTNSVATEHGVSPVWAAWFKYFPLADGQLDLVTSPQGQHSGASTGLVASCVSPGGRHLQTIHHQTQSQMLVSRAQTWPGETVGAWGSKIVNIENS